MWVTFRMCAAYIVCKNLIKKKVIFSYLQRFAVVHNCFSFMNLLSSLFPLLPSPAPSSYSSSPCPPSHHSFLVFLDYFFCLYLINSTNNLHALAQFSMSSITPTLCESEWIWDDHWRMDSTPSISALYFKCMSNILYFCCCAASVSHYHTLAVVSHQ